MLRTPTAELMDDPNLDPALHVQALRGLERLNTLSLSAQPLWNELKKLNPGNGRNAVRVLDIATGSGDIPARLFHHAKADSRSFDFVGCDISPVAIKQASENVRSKSAIVSFIQFDAIKDQIPADFDAVTTSLFTHHLQPEQVIALFKNVLNSQVKLLLVNDLVRSQFSLAVVWLATRVLSRSPIVHFDGPASVRNSYTIEEMKDMAQQAGLQNADVRFLPPCRQLLVWKRA